MNIIGKIVAGSNVVIDGESYIITSINLAECGTLDIDLVKVEKTKVISFSSSYISINNDDNNQ